MTRAVACERGFVNAAALISFDELSDHFVLKEENKDLEVDTENHENSL